MTLDEQQTDDGRPNGGYIQIFNISGLGNNQSTVDCIEILWDSLSNSYLRSPGQPFEPFSYTTKGECLYSANGQSASDRKISNDNIFVNASGGQGIAGAGVMYKLLALGNLVWGPYNADSEKALGMNVIIWYSTGEQCKPSGIMCSHTPAI